VLSGKLFQPAGRHKINQTTGIKDQSGFDQGNGKAGTGDNTKNSAEGTEMVAHERPESSCRRIACRLKGVNEGFQKTEHVSAPREFRDNGRERTFARTEGLFRD